MPLPAGKLSKKPSIVWVQLRVHDSAPPQRISPVFPSGGRTRREDGRNPLGWRAVVDPELDPYDRGFLRQLPCRQWHWIPTGATDKRAVRRLSRDADAVVDAGCNGRPERITRPGPAGQHDLRLHD